MLSGRLLQSAALEYLEYDAALFRGAVALAATGVASLAWRREKSLAFSILSRVHRAGGPAATSRYIERLLARANELERRGVDTGLWDYYRAHVSGSVRHPQAATTVAEPAMLLGYRALVVKSATPEERGVIVVDYSYVFPLFVALFDVEAIAQRYYIVLEPSWRGLCTADILSYSRFNFPVFVETVEPRDTAFLRNIGANFVPVPIAANWWVDHRVVKPDPSVTRDIDVVMTAAWSGLKRHWRFFQTLAALRKRGHRLKVALAGYPMERTRADIESDAQELGVSDQIEIYEGLPLADVVQLLNRAKVQLLWSRKEGANRAIVEALFADVPVIVREGLSYGYRYPYINPQTGRFATEATLGDALLEVIQCGDRYSPRQWALENMSCQRATEVLAATIRERALADGQRWTTGLSVKTVRLETQAYWDPADRARFAADYAFLEQQVRSPADRTGLPELTHSSRF